MTTYTIIDENQTIINVLHFDEEPIDLNPFLDSQKIIFENEQLIIRKVTTEKLACIGNIFDGIDFKPPQPFPSWIWDEAKLVWRAPAMHPDAWSEGIRGGDEGDYLWDEKLLQWVAKV